MGSYWGGYQSAEDYHEIIDEIESNWKLKTVFQYDGKQVAGEIDLEEEDFVEDADFENVEPDDEECDGWTGNEGCTATHFYHRTCVVILPRSHRFDFLFKARNVKVKEYVDTLLSEMQDKKLSSTAREELEKYCGRIDDVDVSKQGLTTIVRATLTLDRPDMLEKIAWRMPRMMDVDMFQELGKGLDGRETKAWQNG